MPMPAMMPGEPASSSSAVAGVTLAPGAVGVTSEKSPAVVKENLDKYIADLHSKASIMTGWVSNLSPPSNPTPSARCTELLAQHFMVGLSLSSKVPDRNQQCSEDPGGLLHGFG